MSVLKYGYGEDISRYFTGLSMRLNNDVSEMRVTYADVLRRLWEFRSMISPFGRDFAGALLIAGALGWTLTAAAARTLWRCAEWRANVIALAFGSLGMFAWFFVFPNHTYVHPQLVSRLLGLSAGFGLVAVLLSAQKWRLVHKMRWF